MNYSKRAISGSCHKSIELWFLLIFFIQLAIPYVYGQINSRKEYIYLNGRLIAVEVTGNSADTTPPTISNVQAIGVTATNATITWTTDEASDSQVEYGLTTSYGSSTPLNGNLVTPHSLMISGLSSNTLYHYRVKSRRSNLFSVNSFLLCNQATVFHS